GLGTGPWLQKASVGAAAPGAQIFAGDPTIGGAGYGAAAGVPLPTGMTLNIPTGTPLGTYAGTLRFFNDRNVTFAEANNAVGYVYSTNYQSPFDGQLDRDGTLATFGQPFEPVSNPTLTLKVKVTENVSPGRFPAQGG